MVEGKGEKDRFSGRMTPRKCEVGASITFEEGTY